MLSKEEFWNSYLLIKYQLLLGKYVFTFVITLM